MTNSSPYQPKMSELISHWTVQEELLQIYRGRLYTIQAILLSFSTLSYTLSINTQIYEWALFLESEMVIILMTGILWIFGVGTLFVFWHLISGREKVVNYWQYLILKFEEKNTIENEELNKPFTYMKQVSRPMCLPGNTSTESLGGLTRNLHKLFYFILLFYWLIILVLLINLVFS